MSHEACNYMISLASHKGNPYLGVYCSASKKHAFVPTGTDNALVETIERSMSVDVVRMSIGGTTIIGSLIASNSKGVVISNLASKKELEIMPDHLEVAIMEEKYNAAGNNILVTDRAALVHPGVSKDTIETLKDVFGVEVHKGTIANISTVGSISIATGKGIVCHPRATEEDIQMLKDVFSVPVTLATLNYGNPWLGACAIGNDNGAVIGDKSTPIEIGKIEDGLNLI